MSAAETFVAFEASLETLVGVIHSGGAGQGLGLLILVGGPQYRVGPHRQFVLLGREFARRGTDVMRFDYRGMGDSTGDRDPKEDAGDIRAAIDVFFEHCPGLREVVLWGSCSAAPTAADYAPTDGRVAGVVLINPRAGNQHTRSVIRLREYYARRLLRRQFWSNLLSGRLHAGSSLKEFGKTLKLAVGNGLKRDSKPVSPLGNLSGSLARFRGKVLLILSANDFGAREFQLCARSDHQWQGLVDSHVTMRLLPGADHTFTRKEWSNWVTNVTYDFLIALRVQAGAAD